jgi:hypothetical protein
MDGQESGLDSFNRGVFADAGLVHSVAGAVSKGFSESVA